MRASKPKLLVLDDYEGVLSKAPSMQKIHELAIVDILDHPIGIGTTDQKRVAEAEIIFALRERTRLDTAFFQKAKNLKLILQSGGHAYHIDQQEATKNGVPVVLGRRVTQPMIVVPELVFAFILGLTRRIYDLNDEMKGGGWNESIGNSIYGKTIGILGYGRHGKAIARLAGAFGMKVIAWNRSGERSSPDAFGVVFMTLEEVMGRSDIVSIHLRLSDESRGLITKKELNIMKPNALIINTSRGAIINERDLTDSLANNRIAGAGLDVFEAEPLASSSPLRTLPNVLLTPHVGWKVEAVLHQFVEIASDQLEGYLNNTLDPKEILNPEVLQGLR